MLRTGVIINIDSFSGQGTISDSNEQDICFDLKHLAAVLSVGSKISFEIEMESKGLMAVKLCRRL